MNALQNQQMADQNQNVEHHLKYFLSLSQFYSIHQSSGGDSYQILLKFLNILNQQFEEPGHTNYKEDELNSFEKHIAIISHDGYQCQKCLNFTKQKENSIEFIQEKEFSIDVENYKDLHNLLTIQTENCTQDFCYAFCQDCCSDTNFKTNRIIRNNPQFIIAKFQYENLQSLSKTEGLKETQLDGKPYKIIGYCSYINKHFTYTAKYNDYWMTFNDNRVYQEQQLFKNIYYLLLEKV